MLVDSKYMALASHQKMPNVDTEELTTERNLPERITAAKQSAVARKGWSVTAPLGLDCLCSKLHPLLGELNQEPCLGFFLVWMYKGVSQVEMSFSVFKRIKIADVKEL